MAQRLGWGFVLQTPVDTFHVNGNARVADQFYVGHGSGSWDWLNFDGDSKELRMHFGDSSNQLRFGRYANGFGAFEANPVRFDMDAGTDTLMVAGNSRVGIGTGSPAYKLDVVGDAQVQGWLRTTGDRGWYSQTHGGGWHMTDTTWLRSYNNKSIYTGGNIRAEGRIYVDNGTNYLSHPSGNYGSLQINNWRKRGWEGFSINGNEVFMNNSANNQVGIYNDASNRWRIWWDADDFEIRHTNNEIAIRSDQDGRTELRHNNTWRARTESNGFRVNGNVRANRYCDQNGNNCVDGDSLGGSGRGSTRGSNDAYLSAYSK